MSWFFDKVSNIGQYAFGQAGAAYQMLVDAFGTPLATTSGALNTFETASMGFDPSTGRTPVEQTNNYFCQVGATAGLQVKAAPGFLHTISVAANWTSTAAVTSNCSVTVTLYDAVSAASPIWRKTFLATPGVGATGGAFVFPPTEEIDALFNTALYMVVTTTDGTNSTLSSVYTTITYR